MDMSNGDDNGLFTYPWWNGSTAFVFLGFFMLWNFIMALLMIINVFAPMSNGICTAGQIILCIFPHWYIGLIIPTVMGGIIPGLLTAIIPYGSITCCAFKKELFGC
jgi:hypothetical protein